MTKRQGVAVGLFLIVAGLGCAAAGVHALTGDAWGLVGYGAALVVAGGLVVALWAS